MANKINQSTITKCMDWAYEKAINGVPGIDSAEELARSYMKSGVTTRNDVDSLIRWQCSKSAISGFVTSFGGFLAMPVALPANLTSVLYVQIRMIAAIAYMAGLDARDDRVRTMVYACLVGSSAAEVVRNVGIAIGEKVTVQTIKKISVQTVRSINKKVGFKLVTKFGEKGLINLGKGIPFIGGIFGGVVDAAATKAVGRVARDTFFPKG